VRNTYTISLPGDLARDLERVTAERKVSRSEIIRDSLRDYLFVRRFKALRRKGLEKARRKGVFTDQDVFDIVS